MGRAAEQSGRSQEVPALSGSWFPRPERPDDVAILPPPGRWGAEEVFEILRDPAGIEWRDKVGVVGRLDGSAKPTTRLLAVRGWVAKTCLDDLAESKDAVRRRMLGARTRGLQADVWHPAKQWILLRANGGWLPLTLCPELRTLRKIAGLDERLRAWVDMVLMAVRVNVRHGLGLDLNPANFGTADDDPHLYYLDDEFYPALTEAPLAGSLVARIPEEPGLEPAGWGAWGTRLVHALQGREMGALSWEGLCDGIQQYPVAEQFEAHRTALWEALRAPILAAARQRLAARAAARAPKVTCVLADVHANLPALEATLRRAGELGADSYLFVGDAVGYGPHPSQCIRRLAELPNLTLLRGNHDHAIGTGQLDVGMNRLARASAEWTRTVLGNEELAWLANLPVDQVGEQWMAVHGAPQDPRRFLAYVYELTYEDNLRVLARDRMPLCFFGHTHVPLVYAELPAGPTKLRPEILELTGRGPYLVNPGAVGQPRDGDPRAAFALWHREERRVVFYRVAYPVEKTVRDLEAFPLPADLRGRLTSGN